MPGSIPPSSDRSLHLLVDLSGHGFGHLAQVAPVLERLVQLLPSLRITIRAALPKGQVQSRLPFPFAFQTHRLDIGLVMRDPFTPDLAASRAWYRQFHASYRERLEEEKARLRALKPNLLLSDIPYLSLEAASALSIPSLALCSLHWGEVVRAYFGDDREMVAIAREIDRAYGSADLFLQPEPSIPMPTLQNTLPIGPIARPGRDRKGEILARFGLKEGARLALVALGGIPARFDFGKFPEREGLFWLLPPEISTSRPDALPFAQLKFPFRDLIASSDLIVTKIGYGTLVEAVVQKKPILCALREIWPETEVLASWCRERVPFEGISRERLFEGDFSEELSRLLEAPEGSQEVAPSGVEQAARILAGKLS